MAYEEFVFRLVHVDSAGVLGEWGRVGRTKSKDASSHVNRITKRITLRTLLELVFIISVVQVLDAICQSEDTSPEALFHVVHHYASGVADYANLTSATPQERVNEVFEGSTAAARAYRALFAEFKAMLKDHLPVQHLETCGYTAIPWSDGGPPTNGGDDLTIRPERADPITSRCANSSYTVVSLSKQQVAATLGTILMSAVTAAGLGCAVCAFARDSKSIAREYVQPLEAIVEDVDAAAYLDTHDLTAERTQFDSKLFEIHDLQSQLAVIKAGIVSFSRYVPREVVA
eukprot:GHVU01006238.1.p1 GENE.GHVU01006238.1~~GHVU01006238.1.p1  ORF type:complete len:336 (+),score=60.24 GHVU01006238.1:149-1009(+)